VPEREEVMQFGVFFAAYAWMILSGAIFVGQRTVALISQIAGMFVAFGSLFIVGWYCQVQASKYFAIRGLLRRIGKSDMWLNLFVLQTGLTPIEQNTSASKIRELPLGIPVKFKPYGEKIKTVRVSYSGEWEKRMIAGAGQVKYKGETVDHGNMCTVVFNEVAEQTISVEYNEPILNIRLANAPGDPEYGTPQQLMLPNNPNMNHAVKQYLTIIQRLNQDKQLLIKRNDQLEHQNVTLAADAAKWHTSSVQKDGVIRGKESELDGMFKNAPDHQRDVERENLFLLSRVQTIYDLGKTKSSWLRFPIKYIALAVLGLGVIGLVWGRPDLTQGFGQWLSVGMNQLYFLIMLAMVLVVVYYLFHRRSTRSENR
jgi:hypothetical protein